MLCAGMLMIVLDVTVTNVALPTIQDDLGFSQSSLAWVVNGYLITFGGLLLLSGRLGDLLGRRRVFLAGLAIFPALMTLAMSGATQEDAGLASGLVNTSAQVGGALGLAVLATLSATRTDDLLASGDSQAEALVGGYHLAFGIGAALLVVALLVGIVVLEKEADAQAHAVEVLDGVPGEREPAYSEV